MSRFEKYIFQNSKASTQPQLPLPVEEYPFLPNKYLPVISIP